MAAAERGDAPNDLGGFLSHLFRRGFYPQLALVCRRGTALAFAPFPPPLRRVALAPRRRSCRAGHTGQVSPFNFVSFTAFLAWFGGIGYLLTRFSSVWFLIALGIALLGGLTGAAIVYLFLSRVLTSEDENLDPADYEMAGVLGRTSVPIRPGGTGEIIYSQAGTRRTCGARSENGASIPKGNEVIVTRYEKGIAYVRLWSEMSGEVPESSSLETLDQPERKDAP
jgi:membrane protein implicated in regulation of membrane protease activity